MANEMTVRATLETGMRFTGYELRIHGERTEEHPKVFVDITVEHIFTGHNIRPDAVERAIELTEERYCGASAMLGKTARLKHAFFLFDEGERA